MFGLFKLGVQLGGAAIASICAGSAVGMGGSMYAGYKIGRSKDPKALIDGLKEVVDFGLSKAAKKLLQPNSPTNKESNTDSTDEDPNSDVT